MAARTPTRITVEVTERDIERAHRNDSYTCVVAQAVARTVKEATRIEVDTQTIRFTVDDERRVYMTPYAVQGYVIAFDAGDAIEPFSFQLRNPRRVGRRIRTEAGKAALRASNKARRAAEQTAVAHPAKRATARSEDDPRTAATEAYREAREVTKGEPATQRKGVGAPPPRVWKRKKRTYGMRLLRINRELGE
jgi:hypothetical protein